MDSINTYIDTHRERFLNELLELLRIPSVSADPKYKDDVWAGADATLKEDSQLSSSLQLPSALQQMDPILYQHALNHMMNENKKTDRRQVSAEQQRRLYPKN